MYQPRKPDTLRAAAALALAQAAGTALFTFGFLLEGGWSRGYQLVLWLQLAACALLVVASVNLFAGLTRWFFVVAVVVQITMTIIALLGLGGWWLGLLPVGTLLPTLSLAFAYSWQSSAYVRWAKGG